MTLPLAGKTIALAEGRQLEELAQMLEKEGATTIRCPMLTIIDTPQPGPVLDWIGDLCAGQFDYVVLMTGEALRRLLKIADTPTIRQGLIEGFRGTPTITRGPKPVRALKEIGLSPTIVADSPTTAGVIAALKALPLTGKSIGLTLYGAPNPALESFITSSGGTVRPVMPYVYAPNSDADEVVGMIAQMAQGRVDAIVFTSSPQVDRLFEVAAEHNLSGKLQEGLHRTQVAAIGPVVAQSLREHGAGVDICPEQGFVMKNLVQQIKRAFATGNT
jgi:uroporphyrinogen-III synthase